jgi:hypothetical protein
VDLYTLTYQHVLHLSLNYGVVGRFQQLTTAAQNATKNVGSGFWRWLLANDVGMDVGGGFWW